MRGWCRLSAYGSYGTQSVPRPAVPPEQARPGRPKSDQRLSSYSSFRALTHLGSPSCSSQHRSLSLTVTDVLRSGQLVRLICFISRTALHNAAPHGTTDPTPQQSSSVTFSNSSQAARTGPHSARCAHNCGLMTTPKSRRESKRLKPAGPRRTADAADPA